MEEGCVVHLEIVDSLHLSLVKPFDTLAVFPEAKLYFVVFGHHVSAEAVLLSLVPEAFVATLVSPRVNAESMLLVVFVLSSIHPSVIPDVNAHSFHVVVEPLSLVLTAVQP